MKKIISYPCKNLITGFFYILALKTVFVSNVFSTITLYHSSFEFARGFINFFAKGECLCTFSRRILRRKMDADSMLNNMA